MYIIDAKTLIGAAFIYYLEETGNKVLPFSKIINYGNQVVDELRFHNVYTTLHLCRYTTDKFFYDYKDWFHTCEINDEMFITLNENIDSNILRNEFGCLLNLITIKAFSSKENIAQLL